MGVSTSPMMVSLFFFFVFASLVSELSVSAATVVVNGGSEWKTPTVQIGDSIIFQLKYKYNLFVFKNQDAFTLCNFTQATLLTKSNSKNYTWHTMRPGFFYFSFYNGSNKACLEGQKLAIKVTLSPQESPAPSPELPTAGGAPPLISGGSVSLAPAYPWPFRPHELGSPSPAPVASSPLVPEKGGEIPFINSNPAVPLPTGEVDSATIRPLPTSCGQVVGFLTVQRAMFCAIFLMLL